MEPEERLYRLGPASQGDVDREGHAEPVIRSLRACLLACALALPTGAAAGELSPNELGRVMILEYHKIDQPEERWTRTPENFRRDLERLWERGYRLVALNDFLDGKINIPRGTTPVILTFDDSSPGQFKLIEKNGEWVVDPDCAVGILEAFERRHPEFGHAATFFVLPGADPPNRLFNQKELASRKLQYLASRGYEIGNHTLWHANLAKYSERVVRQQIATAQEWIQRHVPTYRIRTLALPMGAYPSDIRWSIEGVDGPISYRHDAILMVAGGAAPSPYARVFDPYRLPRIQALESELGRWLAYFERNPQERYVSDGDPGLITVPAGSMDKVRRSPGTKVVERP
jgi:peptidoglycan/xylan/chitin deacetylase (PgdA/CDA1 family)